MIVAMGEVIAEPNGFSGVGWETAVSAVKAGAPSALLSPISFDPQGQAMLEKLVDLCILFDPDLCDNPAPSMTPGHVEGTAPLCIDEEKLLSALRVNTDVRVILMGGVPLWTESSAKPMLSAVRRYAPHPSVVLEPNLPAGGVDDPVWVRTCLSQAAEEADALILWDEDSEVWGMGWQDIQRQCGAHVILNGIWHAPDGTVVTSEAPRDRHAYAGALLAALHQAGVFGGDGQEPSFFWDERVIAQALSEAAHAESDKT